MRVPGATWAFAAACALALPSSARAKPGGGEDFTPAKKLAELKKRVGARVVPLENPCADPGPDAKTCRRRALDRTREKLSRIGKGVDRVRMLQLGDSMIASDLITGMIRRELQAMYGDAGRGFVHPEQLSGYGGRRLEKDDAAWKRDRIVDDDDRAGLPFGFSGLSLEPAREGARASFRLEKGDAIVRIFYEAQPGGADLAVHFDGEEIARVTTRAARSETRAQAVTLPATKKKARGPLVLEALGTEVRLYGLSFEGAGPGVLYDAVGPVGADAKVYLQLGEQSLAGHLEAYPPDLVVFMVGGNDAMKVRKGWKDLAQVETDHRNMIERFRRLRPEADCLLWAPMDAGDREKKKVVSKALLQEVSEMQARVAREMGCGFWDTMAAMGGAGAIGRWDAARVMNADLVHPRRPAADLLGQLFTESWLADR